MDFIVIVIAGSTLLASLVIGLLIILRRSREEAIWDQMIAPPTGWRNQREYHHWIIETTVLHTSLTRDIPLHELRSEVDEWLSLNMDGGMPLDRILKYIRIGLTPKMSLESPYKEMSDEALSVYDALYKKRQ
jgi:hypothetical protein